MTMQLVTIFEHDLHEGHEGGDHQHLHDDADLERNHVPEKRDDEAGGAHHRDHGEAHDDSRLHRTGDGEGRTNPQHLYRDRIVIR